MNSDLGGSWWVVKPFCWNAAGSDHRSNKFRNQHIRREGGREAEKNQHKIDTIPFSLLPWSQDRYRGIMYPLKGPYTKVRAKANIAAIWAIGATVAVPNLLVSIFFYLGHIKPLFLKSRAPFIGRYTQRTWVLICNSASPPKTVFLARGRDRGRKKFYWQLSRQGKGKLNIPSCLPSGLPRGAPSPAALRRRGNGECHFILFIFKLSPHFDQTTLKPRLIIYSQVYGCLIDESLISSEQVWYNFSLLSSFKSNRKLESDEIYVHPSHYSVRVVQLRDGPGAVRGAALHHLGHLREDVSGEKWMTLYVERNISVSRKQRYGVMCRRDFLKTLFDFSHFDESPHLICHMASLATWCPPKKKQFTTWDPFHPSTPLMTRCIPAMCCRRYT